MLVKHGKMTIPKMIEQTAMTKATVYRLFRGLEEKGLAYSDRKRYNQSIFLCSPLQLLSFARREQKRVRKVELKIKDNLESIKRFLKNPVLLPEIQKYFGKDGYVEVTQETLEVSDSEILYCGDLDDVHRVITEEYDYSSYLPRRMELNVFLRMLVGKSKEMLRIKDRDERCLRETRFIDDPKLITASFLVAGESVYFLSHSDEAVAVKISSSSISTMFKSLFEHLWNQAA